MVITKCYYASKPIAKTETVFHRELKGIFKDCQMHDPSQFARVSVEHSNSSNATPANSKFVFKMTCLLLFYVCGMAGDTFFNLILSF